MRASYLRTIFFGLTLPLAYAAPLRAQTAAELALADREACGGYVDRTSPPAVRRAYRTCIVDRRFARATAERERIAAIHRVPSVYVIAGYDGALLASRGRYRSPSLIVGVEIRRNVLERFGVYATLGAAVGRGVIGGGDVAVHGTKSVNAGVSFTGLVEAGIVIGPFRRLYVMLGPQLRLIVPTRNEATFMFNDGFAPPETQTVRWDVPTYALGARPAVGWMLGREHATSIEFSGGLGGVLGLRNAAYLTLGVRVGHTFGR